MKSILKICFSLVLVSLCVGTPIKVGDTNVTFEPPEGFRPVPQEIIDLKWPMNQAPKFVVGNESATTTVAYDLKPYLIPQNKLPDYQRQFTLVFDQIIPGLEWKKNELVDHSGQKWLHMEMTSSAVDTDIYNIMMMTGHEGRMLMFNFNSTKEEFERYESQLRESIASIKLPVTSN